VSNYIGMTVDMLKRKLALGLSQVVLDCNVYICAKFKSKLCVWMK